MAGLRSCICPRPLHILPLRKRRVVGFRCCSSASKGNSEGSQTPQLLRIAVGALTEFLRLFTPAGRDRTALVDDEWKDKISLSNVDDVLSIIRSDYEQAYFVTGLFTSAIYADECTFEDPTIKFQGKDLYARNLSLLLPFLLNPSIRLKKLEKGLDSGKEFIVASWKLRTYLRLPWKPLISVDGRTIYDLDEEFRIVRHVERWNISALEAIIQIFTPSSERPDQ
ncbi:uncharacterized protein LOC105162432 isoform X2 [Sesamum indicum]|uniref:Uncharacterized protein LOC105162432 isoform X2 n=1 Tax=Sesamum indicum TaxID=4182 RepID=A0A6I9T4H2_SESIN|nr:uncharacterized protein LOC105162432 isoform X2 [Sesamum indicum]